MKGLLMPPVLLLLAKAAIAAPAHAEMESLAQAVGAALPDWIVTWAYSEQGLPSLRARLEMHATAERIRILPLSLPNEPGATNAALKAVQRWAAQYSGHVPPVDLAPPLSAHMPDLAAILATLARAPATRPAPTHALPRDAALIPDHALRVLVCSGGPCMNAGAAAVWQHLRHRQDAEKLRQHGEGMMSCRTSCLGPCALAPVMQIWPEGSYYCGVDTDALDRIVNQHIRERHPVADLLYTPDGRKQSLRPARLDPTRHDPADLALDRPEDE
jgi:(2Fe-2S) ferredoxin